MTQQAADASLQLPLHSQILSVYFGLASFFPSQSERTHSWSPQVTWLPWQQQVSQRVPLPPTQAPGLPATVQKETNAGWASRDSPSPAAVCSSGKSKQGDNRNTSLGDSLGTSSLIETNMVVEGLGSHLRQT